MAIIDLMQKELKLEAEAILLVAGQLDPAQVEKAVDLLIKCKGKVVLTGMGKTGIIARKISATLASTGTTSIFLHAAEGIHGDLGMLDHNDVVIAVSYSGNGVELLSLIPFIKFSGIRLIALTGNIDSSLAKASDAVLDCSVPKEFEALGMIPTSSTTVALALGDALAILLLREKNFSLVDFARFHPGGNLGKQLLLKVSDLMHSDHDLPVVDSSQKMTSVILEMTSKKLGCAAVVDNEMHLLGMITDGDLRRQLQLKEDRLLQHKALECMTLSPKRTTADDLAVDALSLMEKNQITMLPVVDANAKIVGMLHMHDLIKAGIV